MASRELRRQSILKAMIRVAGRNGYQATSVADVAAEAPVSRATFYKYFDDKHDCFLAAYGVATERILVAAQGGCGRKQPWPGRALDSLTAIVDLFVDDPALARIAIVEVTAAGHVARQRHWATVGRFARLLEDNRETHGQPQLPTTTALMAASGVVGLIFDELQAGRAATLRRLLPELEFAMLVPFLGPRAAVKETNTTRPDDVPNRAAEAGLQVEERDRGATRSRR
jgi:AcrR family transcriptional regulator